MVVALTLNKVWVPNHQGHPVDDDDEVRFECGRLAFCFTSYDEKFAFLSCIDLGMDFKPHISTLAAFRRPTGSSSTLGRSSRRCLTCSASGTAASRHSRSRTCGSPCSP